MRRFKLFVSRPVELSHWVMLALCVACVGLAASVRLLMGAFGPTLPFATFFPAVLVCALFGGYRAGLLSILLSVAIVWWAFTEPFFAFAPLTHTQVANFVLFSLSSVLVVWLAVRHRRLLATLEQKEEERNLLAGEVAHRSRNVVATVAALIRQTVSDKGEGEKLINRIQAVADTSDLHSDAPDHGTSLKALLTTTVAEPYGADQIRVDGPDVPLSREQAKCLRLVFHEMATNALKYGALSEKNGSVSITWVREDARIVITWCEQDGPKASAPSRYNFGSKLILATLRQMKAEFEPTFAQTGYCYRITS